MDPEVVLVDLPDARVRCVRRPRLDGDARDHLDGSSGTPYLVLHGDGDVEACSPDPDGEPRPGGRFAALTVRNGPAEVLAAHARLAVHARTTGLTVTGPPRERHLPGGAVQVAWPVEEPQTGG